MGDTGLEQPQKTPGNIAILASHGAQSGALVSNSELAALIAAWPRLDISARRKILRIARTVSALRE